jgi:hypothetical protein
MDGMDRWDWGLLGLASFIAIVTLTRLMLAQRNVLLARLRTEMEQQRAKKQRDEQQKKQKEAQNIPRQPGRTTAA